MYPQKYNAKSTWYDLQEQRELSSQERKELGKSLKDPRYVYFASTLEYEVFLELKKKARQGKGHIGIQPKVDLIPPNPVYPGGRNHAIDFSFKLSSNIDTVYIEAKGKILNEYPHILSWLALHNPKVFNNLWIVFRSIPKNIGIITDLQKFGNHPRIVNYFQFKKIKSEEFYL